MSLSEDEDDGYSRLDLLDMLDRDGGPQNQLSCRPAKTCHEKNLMLLYSSSSSLLYWVSLESWEQSESACIPSIGRHGGIWHALVKTFQRCWPFSLDFSALEIIPTSPFFANRLTGSQVLNSRWPPMKMCQLNQYLSKENVFYMKMRWNFPEIYW